MKNLLYTLFAAAATMLAVGCAKEVPATDPALAGETVEATFTVGFADAMTKAVSDGLTATQLIVGVYDKALGYVESLSIDPASAEYKNAFVNHEATFKARLVKGHGYDIVFLAVAPDNGAYTVDLAAKTFTVDTDGLSNDEKRDAFYAVRSIDRVSGSIEQAVVLTRPFAQFNVIASKKDYEDAQKALVTFTKSSMGVTAPSEMNLLDGTVSKPAYYSLKAAPMTETTPNFEPYKSRGDVWLLTDYILVGTDNEVVNDLFFNIYSVDSGDDPMFSYDSTNGLANVPFKRNFRTTVYGNVFIAESEFTITVDPIFDGEIPVNFGEGETPDIQMVDANLPAPGATITVKPGETINFKAVHPVAEVLPTYSSSKDAVGTINGEGLFTAVAEGQTLVTVEFPAYQAGGANPGTDPGTDPGDDPGDNPGDEPGDEPGGDTGDEDTVTDVLDLAATGVAAGASTYADWTADGTSGASYAGQSAGGNDAIQIRSKNSNSGIVTTVSGGKAVKVAVVWNENTSADRTLDIYGSSTAYSAPSDLYSADTKGTLIGSIKYADGEPTEITITDDYAFIGIRSKDGAAYLDKISISWAPATNPNARPVYTKAEAEAAGVNYAACTLVWTVVVSEGGEPGPIGPGDDSFVKVTTAPEDWSGEYLIVYEEGSVAFDASLEALDAVDNYIGVVISNGVIASSADVNKGIFTIAPMEGGYSLKAANGKYIYGTSGKNELKESEEPALNTIALDADGNAIITSNTSFIQYNKASNQNRFRYYKDGTTTQQPVALYKRSGGSVDPVDPDQPVTAVITASDISLEVGAEKAVGATTNSSAPITYTVDDSGVYTVTAEGVVTGVKAGEGKLLLKVEAVEGAFTAAEKEITVTVTEQGGEPSANDGTAEHPYTVAEGLEAIKDLPKYDKNNPKTYLEGVYVSGIVIEVTDAVSQQYGNATYTIADSANGEIITVFRGFYLGGRWFTDPEQIKAGDEVVVSGNLCKYGNNLEPEFAQGSMLYSINGNSTVPEIAPFRIEVSTKPSKNLYVLGDSFDGTGMVVKAYYNDGTNKEVTDYTVTPSTFTTVGDAIEVTVSWNSLVATFTVKVVESAEPVTGDVYAELSGDIAEGDYVIYYDGKAMNNTVDKNRLGYAAVETANGDIVSPDASMVWHIAVSGENWTIYSADAKKYAASTGTKNQAALVDDATAEKAQWTITAATGGGYEIVNVSNAAAEINANLRNNGEYGFACYSTSTGGPLKLYKKVVSE